MSRLARKYIQKTIESHEEQKTRRIESLNKNSVRLQNTSFWKVDIGTADLCHMNVNIVKLYTGLLKEVQVAPSMLRKNLAIVVQMEKLIY